jgi:hypothetical protein
VDDPSSSEEQAIINMISAIINKVAFTRIFILHLFESIGIQTHASGGEIPNRPSVLFQVAGYKCEIAMPEGLEFQ